jgi:hypothetical protein
MSILSPVFVILNEGSSRLGIFSIVPPLFLWDMLLATKGKVQVLDLFSFC